MIAPAPDVSTDKITPDYDKLIRDANNKLARLSDAYLAGAYTVEQFKTLKGSLEAELADLQAEKEKAEIAPAFNRDEFSARLLSVLETVTDPTVPESLKASALRSVISSITFHRPPQTFDIHFYY